MILYRAYAAAIFSPCHPYIWSTTILHDTVTRLSRLPIQACFSHILIAKCLLVPGPSCPQGYGLRFARRAPRMKNWKGLACKLRETIRPGGLAREISIYSPSVSILSGLSVAMQKRQQQPTLDSYLGVTPTAVKRSKQFESSQSDPQQSSAGKSETGPTDSDIDTEHGSEGADFE